MLKARGCSKGITHRPPAKLKENMHLASTPTAPTTFGDHTPDCQRMALRNARENYADSEGIKSSSALLPNEEVIAQDWAALYLAESMTTCLCIGSKTLDIIEERGDVVLLREDDLFAIADRDVDNSHVRNVRFFRNLAQAQCAFTARVHRNQNEA